MLEGCDTGQYGLLLGEDTQAGPSEEVALELSPA